MKPTVFALMAAAVLIGQAASAQVYQRCDISWMDKGRDVVKETCGDIAEVRLVGEGVTEDALLAAYQTKEQANTRYAEYARCVQGFIQNGLRANLPVETLDFATCAHQWAEEQRTEMRVQFGMACIDWEDRNRKSFSYACFPNS